MIDSTDCLKPYCIFWFLTKSSNAVCTFHFSRIQLVFSSLAILILLAAISSVPIGVTAFAQGEIIQYQLACPAGYECYCTPDSGVWHSIPEDGGQGGFSINAGCTEADK
ncbi:MAG TPA: hypothetical protein VLA74_09700 [Nitrososphaeraceae archaeon]|nr:hypothetical protein [Nitrososphaeraceae archaeon]